MAEEAAVVLRAIDETSSPAGRAVAALQGYERQINRLGAQGREVAEGLRPAAQALDGIESRAFRRFEHIGFRMVIGQAAELAGASHSAHGAIRLLEVGLFAVASTAGILSGGMVVLVGVLAAVAAAMHGHNETAQKAKEKYDGMISSLKALHVNAEQTTKDTLAHAKAMLEALKAQLLVEQQSGTLAKKMVTMFGQIVQGAQIAATAIAAMGRAIFHPTAALETLASQAPRIASLLARAFLEPTSAVTELEKKIAELGAEIDAVTGAAADKAMEHFDAMQGFIVPAIEIIGQTIGTIMTGAKTSWKTGVLALIDIFLDAAMKIIAAAIVVSKAVTAMLIPGIGIGVGLAALGAVAALKAVAHAALSESAITETGQRIGAPAATTPRMGAGAAAGPGGQAISTAQKEIVNNVTVNLGVQAIDLAAISDTQLKSMAFRIGKVLREAAAVGQFSLA